MSSTLTELNTQIRAHQPTNDPLCNNYQVGRHLASECHDVSVLYFLSVCPFIQANYNVNKIKQKHKTVAQPEWKQATLYGVNCVWKIRARSTNQFSS